MAREIQKNEDGLKKTPLYDYYIDELGAKITDFGGWALPIQITKIQDEHDAVRNSVGLFDASHMGELRVKGEGALELLNRTSTNQMEGIEIGQGRYTAVTKEDGGTLDDLIVFREGENEYVITPNSGNYEKIYNWYVEHNNDEGVEITNETAEWGLIAVQGPNAEKTLAKLTDADLPAIKSYHFSPNETVGGIEGVVISRTGYTGEDGFELYIPWDETVNLWKQLVEAGQEFDIHECALGARDTLRLEGGMALYGNDLSEDINPIEGGIAFAVKTKDEDKPTDYIGKEALTEFRAQDKKRVSRGFDVTGKGIVRPEMEVKTEDGETVGIVTSGTKSPTFGHGIGYAMINNDHAALGNKLFADVRGKAVEIELCKKDWLRR